MNVKQMPVIVLGVGGVGRALLQQLVEGRGVDAGRNGLHFNVLVVADSRQWIWQPPGLSDAVLEELVKAKRNRKPWGEARPPLPELVRQAAVGQPAGMVVDATAEAGMEPVIDAALELGWGVALANKKPLTGPWVDAQAYFNHPRLRHGATVGGGQPVIALLRYLLDTNDTILSIRGQLSGTLGYICQRLAEDIPYSRALGEAKAFGYTEPDPREDLGGRDVQRKMMILGRMAGWPLEEADFIVEALYPPALAHLSVNEFMLAATALDGSMRDRVAAARDQGQALRYVAEVGPAGGRMGLHPLPLSDPLANLKHISFRTGRFDDEPLIMAGKGAGVQVTAANVHADMLDLGREMSAA